MHPARKFSWRALALLSLLALVLSCNPLERAPSASTAASPAAAPTAAPSPRPTAALSPTPTNTPVVRSAVTPSAPATTAPNVSAGPRVNVRVEVARQRQTIEGFGAGHTSLVFDGIGDTLPPDVRARALDAIYNQVRLTTGYTDFVIHESPGSYEQRRNDDDNPFNINWAGFNHNAADAFKRTVIDPARRFGFDNFFLAQRINARWASPWLADLRKRDYNRFLDEAAEQVAAGLIYWRDTHGITPRYNLLFNEPLSGNGELADGSLRDVVEITKRAGARLRREGFPNVKFVIPNEETEQRSLEVASAVLADPDARQYVGAIGYHPYPYGSPYASVPHILRTAGAGQPDAARVKVRQQLRDLARQYGLPLWMTEVSHGEVDAFSFDALRGRAIHIHDELVYADAAMYLSIGNWWSTIAHELHFGSKPTSVEDGPVVFINNDTNTVTITGMGYAIGHYARWLKRGAVRVEASSADPLVLVSAFRDDAQKQVIIVVIHNGSTTANLNVTLNGVALASNLRGEQSTDAGAWVPLAPFAPASANSIAVSVPPRSVTTIAASVSAFNNP